MSGDGDGEYTHGFVRDDAGDGAGEVSRELGVKVHDYVADLCWCSSERVVRSGKRGTYMILCRRSGEGRARWAGCRRLRGRGHGSGKSMVARGLFLQSHRRVSSAFVGGIAMRPKMEMLGLGACKRQRGRRVVPLAAIAHRMQKSLCT